MDQRVDDFLEHFGVKGMRWGQRKPGTGAASSRKKGSGDAHPASEDAKKAHDAKVKAKTGGTKALSNQELEHLVKRMDLERRYSQVAAKPSVAQRGAKVAGQIISNVGKQQATILLGGVVAKQIAKAMAS